MILSVIPSSELPPQTERSTRSETSNSLAPSVLSTRSLRGDQSLHTSHAQTMQKMVRFDACYTLFLALCKCVSSHTVLIAYVQATRRLNQDELVNLRRFCLQKSKIKCDMYAG